MRVLGIAATVLALAATTINGGHAGTAPGHCWQSAGDFSDVRRPKRCKKVVGKCRKAPCPPRYVCQPRLATR